MTHLRANPECFQFDLTTNGPRRQLAIRHYGKISCQRGSSFAPFTESAVKSASKHVRSLSFEVVEVIIPLEP